MGASVRSAAADALELIRETASLLEEETTILASPEDTNYFRKTYVPKKNVPVPVNSPPKIVPVPDSPPPSPPPEIPISRTEVPAAPTPISSLKSLFAKIAPELPLLNEIPSDAFAKKIATRWKTKNQTAPISILSYSEPPAQKTFLEAIAKALDVYFGPAKIVSAEAIEKEKQWDAFLSAPDLKLIVACDYTLWQLNSLMSFYREDPRKLGNISLFLLPDLSLYLKDPLLKRSLWKALCQKIVT